MVMADYFLFDENYSKIQMKQLKTLKPEINMQ